MTEVAFVAMGGIKVKEINQAINYCLIEHGPKTLSITTTQQDVKMIDARPDVIVDG